MSRVSTLLASLAIHAFIWSSTPLWELGVVINNHEPITYQREVDLDKMEGFVTTSPKNIKALHSNNFIPPIFKEIKNPINLKESIIKHYDKSISSLNLGDRILSVKKLFLNKRFVDFFSLYKSIEKKDRHADPSIDVMYVQNLYLSNEYSKASKFIENIEPDQINADILLYKIKIDIKLKRYNQAQKNIKEFSEKYKDSDLIKYVLYEKQILERSNDK